MNEYCVDANVLEQVIRFALTCGTLVAIDFDMWLDQLSDQAIIKQFDYNEQQQQQQEREGENKKKKKKNKRKREYTSIRQPHFSNG